MVAFIGFQIILRWPANPKSLQQLTLVSHLLQPVFTAHHLFWRLVTFTSFSLSVFLSLSPSILSDIWTACNTTRHVWLTIAKQLIHWCYVSCFDSQLLKPTASSPQTHKTGDMKFLMKYYWRFFFNSHRELFYLCKEDWRTDPFHYCGLWWSQRERQTGEILTLMNVFD